MAKRSGVGLAIDRDWRAESDLGTLMEAHKIHADKQRLAAAKAVAKKKLTAMQEVANGDKHGN